VPGRLDPNSLNFTILDLVRRFRHAFERGITESGIDVIPAEARVLAFLYRHGPLRQNILAEKLCVAQMSVCAFVDRLEAAGIVERRPDPEDRRAKQVHLSKAAEPILSRVAEIGIAVRKVARGDVVEAE
jgi:MarR family transcriptional regulator, transcriptional regulator for hemolysin